MVVSPSFILEEGCGVTMTTLLHFSRSEGQRPWPPDHLPPRREGQWERGRDHGPLPSSFLEEGWGCPWPHSSTFQGGKGGQRSWPPSHLSFRSGMRMSMATLLLSSKVERQRPLLPSLLPLRGWMRGAHDHAPPLLYSQDRKGKDHGQPPILLLEEEG